MAYTVLGSAISPFVRKVMVCLREKNVAFEHEDVNEDEIVDEFKKFLEDVSPEDFATGS